MWTLKKKLLYIGYQLLASWLPSSSHSDLCRRWRTFWAKGIVAQCGKNVNIERLAAFTPAMRIGDYSGVGVKCSINGPVTIGKDVMMGPECIIHTHRHRDDSIDIPMRLQGKAEVRPVTIEDDVWLGSRVIILPGVTIGKGCIIGAGAVVTKDIPAYSVAAGVPAKVIKTRENKGKIVEKTHENCSKASNR